MSYVLRDYQEKAVGAGVAFMRVEGGAGDGHHGLMVEPTGSGKSLVIANIVRHLNRPCLVFQPTKEILEQNLAKLGAYGFEPGVFSASAGQKTIGDRITLATIGSVADVPALFDHVRHVIVDECDLVNPKTGMYSTFLKSVANARVLGLTASPYRLSSDGYGGSQMKFLTRTRPRVFGEVVHVDQIRPLVEKGYLLAPEYQRVNGFKRDEVKVNSTGADFDEESLQRYYNRIGFADRLVRVVNRCRTVGRKRILVFCPFVDDAMTAAMETGSVCLHGKTPAKERARILADFTSGLIDCVFNVNVLTAGYDLPALDTVILGAPTLSLRRYYQQVGRVVRPFPGKTAWVIDMVDNYSVFGRVEDMVIEPGGASGEKWQIWSRPADGPHKPLTNVYVGPPPKGSQRAKWVRNPKHKRQSPYWKLPPDQRPWQRRPEK